MPKIHGINITSLKRRLARNGKPKFRETASVISQPNRILDVGIANDSYLECKMVFPNSAYDGLDYKTPHFEMGPGDNFILCDLDKEGVLNQLSTKYDLIIINHVLEHLRSGEQIFSDLCNKLAPGGVLYAEFPSLRTAYRRKTPQTYHFHDDPTHIRFYRLEDLANLALDHGCEILSCGPISTPLKNTLAFPRAIFSWIKGEGYGSYLLHTLGKIDHMMIQASKQE